MKCSKSGGEEIVKNGLMQGHQRYKCKSCGFSFTKGYRGKAAELKQQALKLYLEGLCFRAIGRLLGISNVRVLNWVVTYGQQAEKLLDQHQAR